MKGIILAGGSATRLYPISKFLTKHLLPVYDKPMIFYSLSVLMLAGIREIMIITSSSDLNNFKVLLGSGKHLGISITYKVQSKPNGIAEAFIIAEEFIKKERITLILGDNLFFGHNLSGILRSVIKEKNAATIFGYKVKNPKRFGVVEFSKNKKVISIEEKPKKPKSNYAIPGLYIYDNEVVKIAKKLKPSKRSELEITDINKIYLKKKKLKVNILGRGFAWLDAGTYDSLLEASIFVQTIESRQGNKIACLEEIAYFNNWISKKKLLDYSKSVNNLQFRDYLKSIIIEKN
jgi:glucose-1-phosphate thymidylyltransferase